MGSINSSPRALRPPRPIREPDARRIERYITQVYPVDHLQKHATNTHQLKQTFEALHYFYAPTRDILEPARHVKTDAAPRLPYLPRRSVLFGAAEPLALYGLDRLSIRPSAGGASPRKPASSQVQAASIKHGATPKRVEERSWTGVDDRFKIWPGPLVDLTIGFGEVPLPARR